MKLASLIDVALWPVLMVAPVVLATQLAESRLLPEPAVLPLVLVLLALVLLALERRRPEREADRPLDQPLTIDAGHFLVGFELGYVLAIGACTVLEGAVRRAGVPPLWPAPWPLVLQLALGLGLYEGASYWQHRIAHRARWLWPFHALHHHGAHMNLVRTVRFHVVDIATSTFVGYLPLVLLGPTEPFFTVFGVLVGAFGLVQHANVRVRTPAWLDGLFCTPAVHRHHHSVLRAEHDRNYGNTTMLFDRLFGTYAAPRPGGPDRLGVEPPFRPTLVDQIRRPVASLKER